MGFEIIDGVECEMKLYINQFGDMLLGIVYWCFFFWGGVQIDVSNDENFIIEYQEVGYYWVVFFGSFFNFDDFGIILICCFFVVDLVEVLVDFYVVLACVNSFMVFEDLFIFLFFLGIVSWLWDFGDLGSGVDNIFMQVNFIYVFSVIGDYLVMLMIMIISGCISSIMKMVLVVVFLLVVFNLFEINCVSSFMVFEVFVGGFVFYEWDFGDLGSGVVNIFQCCEVYYCYELLGIYEVILLVINIEGCIQFFF